MASVLAPEKTDRDAAFQARMEEAAKMAGNATRLSERTGISRRAIGEYLAGNAEPSRPRLVAIARAAGVMVEWLATGEGAKTPGAEPLATTQLIDEDALIKVVKAVEGHLASRNQKLSSEDKGALVATLYRWAKDETAKDLASAPETVEQLVRLMLRRA